MKITKSRLLEIINEELVNEYNQGDPEAPGLGLAGREVTDSPSLVQQDFDTTWSWNNKDDLEEKLEELIRSIFDKQEFAKDELKDFIDRMIQKYHLGF